MRLGTDDRLRSWHDSPLLHLPKSMLHRDQDLRFEKDGPRRLAAQGLPQVLRGSFREGQTCTEARAGPDVLLQKEVSDPCSPPSLSLTVCIWQRRPFRNKVPGT